MADSETAPLLDPNTTEQVDSKKYRVSSKTCKDLLLGFLVVVAAVFIALFFATSNLIHKPHHTNATGNPNSIATGPSLPPGVGRHPFMGYNTWNAYHCDIDESVILKTAQLMVDLGFKDLGYQYVNIDDCYSEKKRNHNGEIVENKKRFPMGMKWLVDQIHVLGMKAGIYSDSGWYTCQMYPGSYLHEEQDVKTFQGDWGFDLLKFDNCAIPFDDIIKLGMIGKYSRMANAVTNVAAELGKEPMLFSLCQWGREQPWLWARHYGQTWRTTDDIGPHWDAISSIINQATRYSWASNFYGHNDLDILEVGNGDLTYEESKSHFTAWALLKSPLLIGTDLSKISNESIEILSNKEIIAINQDPVKGAALTPFRWGHSGDWSNDYTYPAQYWSMESENGTVFMLLNVEKEPRDMTFTFVESPWMRAGALYSVRDLWTHTDNGTHYRNFTAKAVPPHGVVALLLKDVGDEPEGTIPLCAIAEWCTDKNGTIVSGNAGREHDKPKKKKLEEDTVELLDAPLNVETQRDGQKVLEWSRMDERRKPANTGNKEEKVAVVEEPWVSLDAEGEDCEEWEYAF